MQRTRQSNALPCRALCALLALSLLSALPGGAAPAPRASATPAGSAAAPAPTPPYAGAWIVVRADDPRLSLLASGRRPLGALSPNAPGLLLDVPSSSFADAAQAAAALSLVSAARGAGWRAGLAVDLPDAEVPKDPRAAETSSPESLYPGLGRLLTAAQGADLFVLGFPRLEEEDLPARRFVLRRVASSIRAENPSTRIALVFHCTGTGSFPPIAGDLLRDDVAAYVDLVGLHCPASAPEPAALAAEAALLGGSRPLLVVGPAQPSPAALADLATRLAAAGARAVAAPLASAPVEDETLRRLGTLLGGDFGPDSRLGLALGDSGTPLRSTRLVSGTDLGGVVFLPGLDAGGRPYRGPVRLTLDSPSYEAFEVTELATGRSARFPIARTKEAPTLTLSTTNGPVAVVLFAREKPPTEAQKARVEATAARGITAEEILARHQAWRSARDARWGRLAARNATDYRIRIAELNQSLELSISGAFFFEPGKGYDWAWEEARFNGVKWPGKKVPMLPLLQPEKVSELPLELTFGDAYRYGLEQEETVRGIPCWRLGFVPVSEAGEKPIYEGEVWISRGDYSVVRVRARQKNLKGDVQSVDETTDFEPAVPASPGGPAMLFPLHVTGRTIFRTFSRTTVIERETRLTEVVLDPPDFEARKAAAFASEKVMVRDTEEGIRYLEKTAEGGRRPADRAKSSQLFGLGGVYYDKSFDYPLPLLGIYYIDLDAGKTGQQTQLFFGGVVLAGSWSKPQIFGTKLEAGADVFGIAIRGTDTPWVNGEKVEAEAVKQRSFAMNLNVAYPIVPRVKAAVTVGTGYRDFAEADTTAPDFAIPSSHWLWRLEARLTWDIGGYALSGRYGWNRRSTWDPWGYAGNPDWDPGKDTFRNWNVTLAKDFALPAFQRITTSATFAGTENADRFSKIGFGNYGGNSLIGFASGSLRAEKAVIVRGSYGFMMGSVFRLAALYDQAFVWDQAAGYSGTAFGGAGINGQFPGPWATLIQLTTGTPVVGRDKGQTGLFVSLGILKIF